MTITPGSHARARNKNRRAFTLLELVVALVVLGILAALAVPTYLTVIGNAQTSVATSNALSVASDAVAIASTSNQVATDAQFTTAVGEDNGAVSVEPGTYSTNGTTSVITLASGSYDVVVSWPDSVNGAPYVTSTSTATTTTSTTTTTTTTTTTAPYVEAACSVSVTGPYVEFGTPSTWSLSCTGVTGSGISVAVAVPGGEFLVSLESADVYADNHPYAALPSSLTVDQSTIANYVDDSVPSEPIGVFDNFAPVGFLSPQPVNTIGQYLVSTGAGDDCLNWGSGCGTPTVTTSGF